MTASQGNASVVDVAGASLVDVAGYIDQQPVGGFQIRLLLTCAAVLFLDGFDTQAIGYVAPALAKEWGLSKAALGPVFSAGLFGLMIGALVFGPLADRIGRKKIIIFSTLAFGIGTLATSFVARRQHAARDPVSDRARSRRRDAECGRDDVRVQSAPPPRHHGDDHVLRLLGGRRARRPARGGADPAIRLALGVRRRRRRAAAAGADPGAAAAGIGALPGARGRAPERVAELLGCINPKAVFAPATQFVVHEPRLTGIPVLHLFRDGRTLPTLLLWVVFFMSLLDLYFLSNWLPTVLNDLGASVSTAAVIGSMLQVGGVVGTFALGSVIDRFSFRALALVYFIAVFAVGAIGQLGHSVIFVTTAIFAAGFCIVGGQIAANALAAAFYPTSVRATGVGWALGIGRVGSIVGPWSAARC